MDDTELRLECLRITGDATRAAAAYAWVMGPRETYAERNGRAPTPANEDRELDQVAATCAAYRSGKRIAEISKEVGIPMGSIYAVLKKGGVVPMRNRQGRA